MYNLYSLFEFQAKIAPDHTALVFRDETISYGALASRIDRTAQALYKLGVGHGTRVGFLFPNGPQIISLFYACWKLGAVAVPLNYRLKPAELLSMTKSVGCRLVICDSSHAETYRDMALDQCCPRLVCYTEGVTQSIEDLSALIADSEPAWAYYDDPAAEDDALFSLSSGTTGQPKCIIHTQQSLLFTVLLRNLGPYGLYKGDVFLNYAPLFHFGGINFMIGMLSAGGTLVLMESFNTDVLVQTIETWKVTHLFLIPAAMCTRIKTSSLYGKADLSSVKNVLMGGTIVSEANVRDAFEVFTNPAFFVSNGYGTSENGITTLSKITRDMLDSDPETLQAVGDPVSLSLLKLVDENGKEVPTGEVGEAYGRSPCQMKGYLCNPNSLADGWVMTGDLLRRDEKGRFFFVDRKKDVIRTGGENVSSYEVEQVLLKHPAVRECAVFGVRHSDLGEAIVAAVIPQTGAVVSEEEIVLYCKQHIANFKKPQRVLFMDNFPRNGVGKTDKKQLRRQFNKLFVP